MSHILAFWLYTHVEHGINSLAMALQWEFIQNSICVAATNKISGYDRDEPR